MGNGKHGWHHAWHKILNTLMQKHHRSYLSNLQSWKINFSSNPIFFKIFIFHTFLAACSYSQPLAVLAATRSPSQPLAATRSHLQPLAATCSSQPLEWPQVAASGRSKRVAASGRKWPLQASGRKWPPQTVPMVASCRKWPQVAAPDSSKWPLQPVPSEWPQVAARGRFLRFQFPPSKQPPWYIFLLRPLRSHKNGDENTAIFNIPAFWDRWEL